MFHLLFIYQRAYFKSVCSPEVVTQIEMTSLSEEKNNPGNGGILITGLFGPRVHLC